MSFSTWRRTSEIVVLMLTVGLGLAGPAGAQATGGVITGVISDAQGGVLPGVTVTLRNVETGITRTNVTEANGRYRFAGLLSGRYALQAELSGFAQAEVSDLTITIGLELRRDLAMALQGLQEALTVTATAPVVETTRHEVSGVVTQEQIETLPVADRQPITLLLLMPGVTRDTDNNRRHPSLSIGAGNMATSQTAVVIDGGMGSTGSLGSTRQDYPQAAIQEFKAHMSQAPPEIGGTVGGAMVMVTKSGTNQFRGEVFEFFRDKSLNALNKFEAAAGAGKPAFHRHQFGAALGGPVVRNRLHFFVTSELTRVTRAFTVSTGQPQFYSALEGNFDVKDRNAMHLVRADFQMTPQQTLFVRHAYQSETIGCESCGGNTAAFASFENLSEQDSTMMGHTWVLGSRMLNEIRVQSPWGTLWRTRRSPPGVPIWDKNRQFDYPPERFAGRTAVYSFPSLTWGSASDEFMYQQLKEVRNDLTMSTTRHSVKVGAGFWTNPQPESVVGNPLGTWTFATDQFFDGSAEAIANLRNPIQFTASFPPINRRIRNNRIHAYVQDEWRARSNLTVSYGVRYDNQYGGFNQHLDLTGRERLREFIDPPSRGDGNNFGPRTGVAWDVRGTGRLVVRGGYGMYYQYLTAQQHRGELDALLQNSISIRNPSYPDPYGGRSPEAFVSTAPPNINILDDEIRNAVAHTSNLGFSRELKANLAIHADATYTKIDSVTDRVDINTPDPITGQRPYPAWGFIRQNGSGGESTYRALYVRLDKRFADRHQYLVSYALAGTRNTGAGNQAIVTDIYNPALDLGPADAERRHALTASGSVLFPFDVTVGAIWTVQSARPFSARAGIDLNRDGANTDYVPGTTRNIGNRDNARMLDLVNAWRGQNGRPPISADQIEKDNRNFLNLRVSKGFAVGANQRFELIGQVFNVLGRDNLADAGDGNVGNALSASFGRILTAQHRQQAEVAARFIF